MDEETIKLVDHYQGAKLAYGFSCALALSSLVYGSMEYVIDGKLDHPLLFGIPILLSLVLADGARNQISDLESLVIKQGTNLS